MSKKPVQRKRRQPSGRKVFNEVGRFRAESEHDGDPWEFILDTDNGPRNLSQILFQLKEGELYRVSIRHVHRLRDDD